MKNLSLILVCAFFAFQTQSVIAGDYQSGSPSQMSKKNHKSHKKSGMGTGTSTSGKSTSQQGATQNKTHKPQ